MKSNCVMLNFIAAFALILAELGAENNSYLWIHQPKFPEKLRKR